MTRSTGSPTRAGIVSFGTDLDNPDFAAMAQAAGLFGVQVDKAGELKGFTLYATRTILSGEGKELIDLTKSNLRDLEVE